MRFGWTLDEEFEGVTSEAYQHGSLPLHILVPGGTLVRRARAGHLFGPVPHWWLFRRCTKGAHLAQCSYLGAWLY